jgi:hypothetical protein
VGGRPIRPGAAETDAVLLPLEKGRANEEAPIFVVELVYLQPIEPWSGKGRAHIDLPAVDLPISITNVELHYSPRFRVEPQPGTFRVETDPRPPSAAFRLSTRAATTPERPPQRGAASGLQTLVDRFKNDAGGRSVIGALPVRVDVPAFGPAVFLASELTAEASTPGLDLLFRRVR